MIVEDQSEAIDFLSRPRAFGAGAGAVERIETHISEIFLVGERAYKLKRAVRLPYLDFSTADLRRVACESEVAVNRRTAPDLYLGVVPLVRGADGALRLGGDGAPVDWLVEMVRFDQSTLFDRLAREGGLDRALAEDLAEAIARFHRRAEPMPDGGGRAGMAMIIDSNAETFAEFAQGLLDGGKLTRLDALCRQALDARTGLLETRRASGQVRHCHGDLHLRNICLVDGMPTLFDAIEFNDAFTRIDVLYDLAFLLMDLDHRDLRGLANIVLNHYLDITEDTGGLGALPLFLAIRAAIRAHVDATQVASLADRAQVAEAGLEAGVYLDEALAYLVPPAPRLIAVGGFSGSGKSRMARELAPFVGAAPGARVLRSDVIRKRLAGVHVHTRLEADGYTAEMTERTFGTLYAEAEIALAAGHSVIADAVFAFPLQRAAIAAVAERTGVPFLGLWLEAPAEVCEHRAVTRKRNASDAGADIVRAQHAFDVGPIDWHRIDTGGSREESQAKGLAAIGL